MNKLQIELLFPEFDNLQLEYGDSGCASIYGAGNTGNPRIMFIFMNPTGRNIASAMEWNGIRAPWIGTKQVWKLFRELYLIPKGLFSQIRELKSNEWDERFSYDLYTTISKNDSYITNFAKCTMNDARPISNKVFRAYYDILLKEISIVNPKVIITFGNQVSSNLLKKSISVSNYLKDEYEEIKIDSSIYPVFPTYYPVGQGQRNMSLAKDRLLRIINKYDT